MKPSPYRPAPKRIAARARPATTGRSQTRPGFSFQTPAACSGTAEAGDRHASPCPSAFGRRFFLGLGALLGGAGAYGAHDRFTRTPVERRAEPYSGPITLAHETPTLVQTHAENSSPAVVPGRLSLTVEYGAEESIGGVSFREIRGVRRVS